MARVYGDSRRPIVTQGVVIGGGDRFVHRIAIAGLLETEDGRFCVSARTVTRSFVRGKRGSATGNAGVRDPAPHGVSGRIDEGTPHRDRPWPAWKDAAE
jgi:hypothetical protein